MKMNKTALRGSGFKHTLPAVLRFSAIWVLVVVLTALVIPIAMMMGGIVPPSQHSDVWFVLYTRVPVIALAAMGLAIFTTNRLAGPFVPLKRVFEAVKQGDMDCRLRFRQDEKHLRELEVAFDQMMVTLRERTDSPRGSGS